MKDVSINGLQFRFDNGCLDWMRQARNSDEQNPLEGVNDQNEIAAIIMYGGMARVNEKQEKPVEHSLAVCRKMIKDLSPAETSQLINSWSAAMMVTEDSSDIEQAEGEEKKSS